MAFHTWVSTDTPEHDSCLVCGGMWVNSNPGSVVLELGQITAINGEPAVNCTSNTQQCHHYHNEHANELTVCRLDTECNCLFCNS
jgi:hypothetical protein